MDLTKEEFRQTLLAKGILTEPSEAFLIALAKSPSRSATADQMAKKLGYDNKVTPNQLIGKLGGRIAVHLGIEGQYKEKQTWPLVADWFNGPDGFYWQMKDNLFDALDELNLIPETEFGEEESYQEADGDYYEGHSEKVNVNRYERNRKARNECIQHYGAICQVCTFDFKKTYGPVIGTDFIHVHHLVELASIGENYKINPVKDLRPVCPNCHSMIHRKTPAYTIEEIKAFMRESKK